MQKIFFFWQNIISAQNRICPLTSDHSHFQYIPSFHRFYLLTWQATKVPIKAIVFQNNPFHCESLVTNFPYWMVSFLLHGIALGVTVRNIRCQNGLEPPMICRNQHLPRKCVYSVNTLYCMIRTTDVVWQTEMCRLTKQHILSHRT